jgi:putative nucleotidyltransferase with HDIG domain
VISNKKSEIPKVASELLHNPRSFLRSVLIIVAYLLAFVILDLITRQFEVLQGVVAWYPPAGLTYALLLVFGVRYTPAVTIALFLSNIFIYHFSQPAYLLFLLALIISLIYSAAAWFLRHRIHLDWQLRKLRDVVWFVFTTVLVSAILAILSVLSSAFNGNISQNDIFRAIFDWWIGETVGVLTVTPFMLIFVIPTLKRFIDGQPIRFPAGWSLSRRTLPIIIQWVSLAFILYWVFGAPVPEEFRPLFLITLPLIWIALDRGLRGVSAAILLLNTGVVLAVWLFQFAIAQLGALELLMIISCIVGLLMGAVVTDRKQGEQEIVSLSKFPSENPNPVLRLSRDGIVIYANTAGSKLMGIWGFVEGGTAPQLWCDLVAQALANKENKTIDIEADGKVYAMSVTPIPEADYVNLYARDVTERKQAEDELIVTNKELLYQNEEKEKRAAELTKSKEFLDEAGRLARIGSWEIDIKNNELSWSDIVYQIHEIESDYKPTVESAINFYAPEAIPVISEAVNQAIKEGKSYDIDLQLITAKHNRVWVRAIGQAYRVNGEIVKIGGVFQDINERKVAEQELVVANKELIFQNEEKEKRASELVLANQELLFQNEEKEKRAAELVLANQELLFQNEEKEKRAAELIVANQEIIHRLQNIRALSAIDQAITGSFDLSLTLNVILDQVKTQLNVDAAVVLLFNPQAQVLEFAAGTGFRGKEIEHSRLHLGEGYSGRAALERRTVSAINLLEKDTQFIRAPLLADEGFATYSGTPLIAKGQVNGVLEVYHRSPFAPDENWLEFFKVLAGQTAIAVDSASLFTELKRSNAQLFMAYDSTIEGWSHALDLRDKETEGHTERVTEMTMKLAKAAGITQEELVNVRRGALLHDIGKMGVPDHILLKPGKLTDEERVAMRKHPTFAFELLSPIAYLQPAIDIPYCHHEKWDGSGYPRGLKGEQIPLVARLFSIVDVWDALLSDRPYRQGWPKEKVIEHIKSLSGIDFDPKVVELFLKVINEDSKGAG